MTDDTGKEIQEAGPSTPVRLLGLRSVPSAGMELLSVESESIARQIAERRYRLAKLRLERDLLRNVTSTDGRNKTSLSLVSPSLKNRLAYAEANSASLITTHSGIHDSLHLYILFSLLSAFCF